MNRTVPGDRREELRQEWLPVRSRDQMLVRALIVVTPTSIQYFQLPTAASCWWSWALKEDFSHWWQYGNYVLSYILDDQGSIDFHLFSTSCFWTFLNVVSGLCGPAFRVLFPAAGSCHSWCSKIQAAPHSTQVFNDSEISHGSYKLLNLQFYLARVFRFKFTKLKKN